MALLVYRDSSGQTSLFPLEIIIIVVVVVAVAVAVALAVAVAVAAVAAAAAVVVAAHNENSHDNTGVVSTIIMIRTTSPYSQHDDMIVLR